MRLLLLLLLIPAIASAAPGDAISGANQYFVDSVAGSNGNNGTSHTTPWADLEQTEGNVSATSADIWAKAGSTFNYNGTGAYFFPVSGTSSDPSILGCYETSTDGTPRVCDPDVHTKPKIDGPLDASCRSAGNCVFTSLDFGLLTINKDYVTVDSWQIVNAQGRGISSDGDLSPGGDANAIIIRNSVLDGLGAMVITLEDGQKQPIVEYNVATEWGVCEQQHPTVAGGTAGDSTIEDRCQNAGTRTGGIAIIDDDNPDTVAGRSNALIQHNTMTRGAGEGINCLRAGGAIVRYNTVVGTYSGPLYGDQCQASVWEHNIVMRESDSTWLKGNGEQQGAGQGFEWYGTAGENGDGNVWRNNLLAGRDSCLSSNRSANATGNFGYEGYGNSCLGNDAGFFVNSNLASNGGGATNAVTLRSNALIMDAGDNACNVPSYVDADYTASNIAISDADCQGANDTTGSALGLAVDTFAAWQAFDAESLFTVADATPQAGSALIGAGDPSLETTVVLDDANYPQFADFDPAYTPSAADWEKALAYDYNGGYRSASAPTAGAIEYNAVGSAYPTAGLTLTDFTFTIDDFTVCPDGKLYSTRAGFTCP